MTDIEIRIKLYCYESRYNHTIYLYYDSKELAEKYFWNPIKIAQDDLSFSGMVTSINIPSGLIEVGRYFQKDYKENGCYKIEVGDVVIDRAKFLYENDTSKNATYDNIIIKDVNIEFKNDDCKKLHSDKNE